MRIISGYLKGKKINLPKDKLTRPLKDMVKESIFNIIEHSSEINYKVADSVILDLFSGSGSFGLECISRGAKFVFFCENYQNSINILEKNINLLIEKIYEMKILKKNGTMIIHRNKKIDEDFSPKFKIIDTRYYGLSKIIFGI